MFLTAYALRSLRLFYLRSFFFLFYWYPAQLIITTAVICIALPSLHWFTSSNISLIYKLTNHLKA